MHIVIDTETSIDRKHGPRPYYGAVPVIGAFAVPGEPTKLRTIAQLESDLKESPGYTVIVGHNLLFDLLHLTKDWTGRQVESLLRKSWWDTQLASTMISGHANLWPTLEKACVLMGITSKPKDEEITMLFKTGIGADRIMETSDRMRDKLAAYLKNDIEMTSNLYIKQKAHVNTDTLFLLAVRCSMNVLKYLFLCYRNGLPIDEKFLGTRASELAHKATTLSLQIYQTMVDIEPAIARATDLNVNSRNLLVAFFMGGSCEMMTRELIGHTKTGPNKGSPRYRINKWWIKFPVQNISPASLARADLEIYVNKLPKSDIRRRLAESYLEYKDVEKLGGLIKGARKYVQPDKTIRPQFSLVGANTGRKVCSAPNAQQWPASMRPAVKARANHKIVAADFKQIEVCAWAALSGDKKLIQDLKDGLDLHTQIQDYMSRAYQITLGRRTVKGLVFGAIYGAGTPRLSEQSGVDITAAKAVIDSLKALYPTAWAYYKRTRDSIDHIYNFFDPLTGHTERKGNVRMPSGRRLGFCTKNGKWPYTELRNRPIQSFATADCVGVAEEVVVGRIVSYYDSDVVRPINTVHDELVFEVHDNSVSTWTKYLQDVVATSVRDFIKSTTGHDIPITLNVSVGDTWAECKV